VSASATRPRTDRVGPDGAPPVRTIELGLARAHLRLGALALARVELETMAGLGLLDTSGFVDLAEARWRTGDLLGAGEAANVALRDDEDLPVALLIAAEAAAALGRPTEARRLASRVLADAPDSIDSTFAGMPRSSIWPDDAAEPPPTAPTLFDHEPEPAGRVDGGEPAGDGPPTPQQVGVTSPAAPVALGFWDGEADLEPASVPLPDPALELEAGRAALVSGALDEAALRFGLALRLAPALAPAVLEATDGARSAVLTMVRGDAYRLAGHEREARQAYAVAARGGLAERRRQPRPTAGPTGTTEAEATVVATGASDDEVPPTSEEAHPAAAVESATDDDDTDATEGANSDDETAGGTGNTDPSDDAPTTADSDDATGDEADPSGPPAGTGTQPGA
jgi:tetratricopeptide (TPR) repeat protein